MPRRIDLLAAHMAALDPGTERARERLDREAGPALARLLLAGLSSRSVTGPLARTPRVAVAAAA